MNGLPTNSELAKNFFDKGYLLQKTGHLDRAAHFYKRSIKFQPSAQAHTFLGWVYSLKGLFDQAKEKDTWVEEIHVAQYFADIQVINSIRWIDTEWGVKINIGDLKQLGKDILLGEENTLFNPSVII